MLRNGRPRAADAASRASHGARRWRGRGTWFPRFRIAEVKCRDDATIGPSVPRFPLEVSQAGKVTGTRESDFLQTPTPKTPTTRVRRKDRDEAPSVRQLLASNPRRRLTRGTFTSCPTTLVECRRENAKLMSCPSAVEDRDGKLNVPDDFGSRARGMTDADSALGCQRTMGRGNPAIRRERWVFLADGDTRRRSRRPHRRAVQAAF